MQATSHFCFYYASNSFYMNSYETHHHIRFCMRVPSPPQTKTDKPHQLLICQTVVTSEEDKSAQGLVILLSIIDDINIAYL